MSNEDAPHNIQNSENQPILEDNPTESRPPLPHRTNVSTYFGSIPEAELNALPSPLQRFIAHLQDHVQLHLRRNESQTQTGNDESNLETPMEMEEPSETEEDSTATNQAEDSMPSLEEDSSSTVQDDETMESSPSSSLPLAASPPPPASRPRPMIRFVIIYENAPEIPPGATNSENAETTTESDATPQEPSANSRHLVLNLIFNDGGSQTESFNDLMNRFFLMHQTPGPPPTSKRAMELLREVEITKEIVDGGNGTCSVCFDEFVEGSFATGLPCQHVFHKECLNKWLEEKNTCPLCRYEMPTDDADYEKQRVTRMATRQVDETAYFGPTIHEIKKED